MSWKEIWINGTQDVIQMEHKEEEGVAKRRRVTMRLWCATGIRKAEAD
jgi:hypothetical protein